MKTANPNAVKDVNAKSGPRTGNASARPGKRGVFQADKASKQPVATAIVNAYAARDQKDFVNKKLEPIASNTKGKKFS